MGIRTNNVYHQIKRTKWNLQRFGFSPEKLRKRLTNVNASKIFCVCMPKSGTHLLERALCLHPNIYRKFIPTLHPNNIEKYGGFDYLAGSMKPGEILISHLYFQQEWLDILTSYNIAIVLMVRDPRDLVVSQAFYIPQNPHHHLYSFFSGMPNLRCRIETVIEGSIPHCLPSINERLLEYKGWLDSGCFVVRFEDLVGKQGGGSETIQMQTLQSLYDHCGVPITTATAHQYTQRIFGDSSPTFRRGMIAQWENHFDAELLEMFEKVAGSNAKAYGY